MEENIVSSEKIKKLGNQVWVTRMSRINAEKRMLHNENFIQGINIYYSCFIAFASICLLRWKGSNLDLLITFMSVALLIVVLYFKGLRFSERAFDFRRIYTELQKLEFELNGNDLTDQDVKKIEERYCDLMREGENHISFDYYKALWNSTGDFRKQNCTQIIKISYIWGIIWRFCIMITVIVSPLLLLILAHFLRSIDHGCM